MFYNLGSIALFLFHHKLGYFLKLEIRALLFTHQLAAVAYLNLTDKKQHQAIPQT